MILCGTDRQTTDTATETDDSHTVSVRPSKIYGPLQLLVCMSVALARLCGSVCRTSWRIRRLLIASRTTTRQNDGCHSCWRTWTVPVCLPGPLELQCHLNHSSSQLQLFWSRQIAAIFSRCSYSLNSQTVIFIFPEIWFLVRFLIWRKNTWLLLVHSYPFRWSFLESFFGNVSKRISVEYTCLERTFLNGFPICQKKVCVKVLCHMCSQISINCSAVSKNTFVELVSSINFLGKFFLEWQSVLCEHMA